MRAAGEQQRRRRSRERRLLEPGRVCRSRDGLSFSNDFRFNDAVFDPQLGAPNFQGDNPPTFRIGEYNGIAAVNGIAYVTWTGNSGGGQRVLFDLFSILGAFPDRFEPNEAINFAVNASLGSDDTYNEPRLTLHSATDVDFFKITALHTGKLGSDRFQRAGEQPGC
jgi:hypothetical protein